MAYKPVGNPLPLDIFDPQAGPDHRVDMGAYQRLQYSPQDPATSAGLGLPQQYTTSQPYDGDPAVMQQAYADQEARLGPMRVPSETSDEGLGLTSSMQAQPVSSGPSDFNWLTAIGAGLQSAGAAHFGNFNVPQQYMQLKQQADQRKQEFAKQQATLEEQKKQHAFQQVTTVLANKDMSESQKASLLEGFAKGENPMIAQFARTAMDGIGKKRMGRIGLYMERYPSQVEKIVKGMQEGQMSADDIDARLSLMDEVEKHNAKITGETDLEDEIRSNPQATPGQKAWLQEREAKRLKDQTEANLKAATAPFEEQSAALKPIEQVANINHKGAESQDRSTLGRQGEALHGIPWGQMTQQQKQQVVAEHQRLAVEQQEAGARAREQVKTESSLAPGVMIHKKMTEMVKDVKDMFLDEATALPARIGQMAKTRAKYFAGDESMRQWSQMEDGMRATLARMAMEVGNLAATEQDRAKQLVPDLYGSFRGVPDSKQVAEKKLQLLGEFLQAGLEGPQGPDAQSRVQNKLRETLKKLDEIDPLPPVGNVSPAEEKIIREMQAAGRDKRSIQAAILQQREGK